MTGAALILCLVVLLIGCDCDDKCQADKQWEAADARWEMAHAKHDYEGGVKAWKDECYWHKRGSEYEATEPDCEKQQF